MRNHFQKLGIRKGEPQKLPSPGGKGMRGGGWNTWDVTLTPPVSSPSQRLFPPGWNPLRGGTRAGGRRGRGGKSLLLILCVSIFLATSMSYSAIRTFKDEVGREVTFPFPPKRIVSLAPNITEILFGLGLDEEIVGVSIHCNFPEKAKTKVRVGSYISLDYERITSLKPDLIIATGAGNTREMVDRLEKLGFSTYVIYPKNFDDILKNTAHIGQVVNREKEARVIVEGMRKRSGRVVELTKGLPRPKVFIQIGDAPMVTVGKGSFADDLIRLAGGENVAGKEKEVYPRFGMEEILKRSPEVIIISSMNPKGDYQKILQEWTRWKTIPAVKNGRIHLIDSDLIDRPSPRIIDGLEELARVLHPERFKKSMQNEIRNQKQSFPKKDEFVKSCLTGEPRIGSGAGTGVQASSRRKSGTILITGVRLEFIQMNIGAGMTIIRLFRLFTTSSTVNFSICNGI